MNTKNNDDMKYMFQISIGDWSGDGHGEIEYFTCYSNKPIEDVREAYFKAKQLLPEKFCPENFVCDYEIDTIPISFYNEILDKFPQMKQIGSKILEYEECEEIDLNSDFMAFYTIEFIKKGDKEIRFEPFVSIPTLSFYGFDEKKRHIGYIGYGLFSL